MTDRQPPSSADPGTIVVRGTGRVSVAPDVAELRLGVAVTRPTAAGARADAATTMAAILAAVEAAGVPRADVRTSMLSVQPRYDYRDGRAPTLTGYELANVVSVTVRDLARLGEVVDGTLGAGATSMDGLSFRVDDPMPAERAARMAAMVEARVHADVLAEAAGLSIRGVRSVVEGEVPGLPSPRAKLQAFSAADVATPVEAGTTEIEVTVTVTFLTD
jgi:uncharacterized protein YggE